MLRPKMVLVLGTLTCQWGKVWKRPSFEMPDFRGPWIRSGVDVFEVTPKHQKGSSMLGAARCAMKGCSSHFGSSDLAQALFGFALVFSSAHGR